MIEILRRELLYVSYYFCIQFEQIFKYWLIGILIGSVISVFAKQKIHDLFERLNGRKLGIFGVIPASLLGIASPLCMYGTIPIAASFSEEGMREDWLAAFMMSSILLNPQLIIYSAALGTPALIIRVISCTICGIVAGLIVYLFFRKKRFFDFKNFGKPQNRDTDPNLLLRLLKNIFRNIRVTGPYFLLGVLLAALFQHYVPSAVFASLFGAHRGFGVLMAATVGVPLYVCGGGTIPLLVEWMNAGMGIGSVTAFMITGPATKITNLGALKIVLGFKHFIFYILFVIFFAMLSGWLIDIFVF